VAPTGFEPVFESRPRFRSAMYEVTSCLVPKTATRLKHAPRCSLPPGNVGRPKASQALRGPGLFIDRYLCPRSVGVVCGVPPREGSTSTSAVRLRSAKRTVPCLRYPWEATREKTMRSARWRSFRSAFHRSKTIAIGQRRLIALIEVCPSRQCGVAQRCGRHAANQCDVRPEVLRAVRHRPWCVANEPSCHR